MLVTPALPWVLAAVVAGLLWWADRRRLGQGVVAFSLGGPTMPPPRSSAVGLALRGSPQRLPQTVGPAPRQGVPARGAPPGPRPIAGPSESR